MDATPNNYELRITNYGMEVNIYSWLADYKGLPAPVNLRGIVSSDSYKGTPSTGSGTLDNPKGPFNNYLGQPVICGITLIYVKGNLYVELGSEAGISIAPMMMVSGHKRIVKTPIAGNKYPGTIKELITLDDYRIRIWGVLLNRDQRFYPTAELDILKMLWNVNNQIQMKCEITNDLFQNIVIEDIKLDELRMKPGVQFYEINAISDGFMLGEDLDLLTKNTI